MPPSPKLKKILLVLAVLVLSLLGYGAGSQKLPALSLPSPAGPRPGYYKVSEVLDGDTITVQIQNRIETVRLIGLDTPETQDPRKSVQCFGREATRKMAELIGSQTVRLTTNPEDNDRDKYGRLLRFVNTEGGTFLNAEMIKQGYAFAYTIFPFAYLDEFRQLEHDARAKRKGLWSACLVDESSEVKQTNDQP